jgi:hypothetical protein
MKKLIVALMVLSTLASCGKDNKVASGTTVATSPVTTGTVTTTDPNGILLGQKIDSHLSSFGIGRSAEYNMTYSELINRNYDLKYRYTKSTSSSSNCEVKWGIVTICKQSSSSTTPAESRAVIDLVSDRTAANASKQVELKTIINNRHPGYAIQSNGSVFYVKTLDGKVYAIDTTLPLRANPAYIQDSSGSEQIFSIKLNGY